MPRSASGVIQKLGLWLLPALILSALSAGAQTPESTGATAEPAPQYRVDQPGTITFTVGVRIEGKVERPQVVIFLPKEKPYYREVTFSHSFVEEIDQPLPLRPLTSSSEP